MFDVVTFVALHISTLKTISSTMSKTFVFSVVPNLNSTNMILRFSNFNVHLQFLHFIHIKEAANKYFLALMGWEIIMMTCYNLIISSPLQNTYFLQNEWARHI